MKATTTIDHAARTARLEITLEAMDDAAAAIDGVLAVARVLWPEIVITYPSEESIAITYPSEEGDAPAPAVKGKRRASDHSKPPREGSVTARVLEACRRLGTTDFQRIADELDLFTHVAGSAIASLRKGGHLK